MYSEVATELPQAILGSVFVLKILSQVLESRFPAFYKITGILFFSTVH